jgi:hypothetical protein
MLRALTFVSLATLFGAAVLAGGCGKALTNTPPKASTSPEHKGHVAKHEAQDSGPAAPEAKPLASSAEDRELIAKQKICPVTGQALGSMGDPVKVVVKGRTVFLCCSGCEAAIKKDPDKYLARLSAAGQQ